MTNKTPICFVPKCEKCEYWSRCENAIISGSKTAKASRKYSKRRHKPGPEAVVSAGFTPAGPTEEAEEAAKEPEAEPVKPGGRVSIDVVVKALEKGAATRKELRQLILAPVSKASQDDIRKLNRVISNGLYNNVLVREFQDGEEYVALPE